MLTEREQGNTRGVRLDIRKDFFTKRDVKPWHKLSRAAVESPSPQGLKRCRDVTFRDMG